MQGDDVLFGSDAVARNAELRRRHHARFPVTNINPTSEESRLGMNGAVQATGHELARLTALASVRATYNELLNNLQKFETQCQLYNKDSAWQAYQLFHDRLRKAAEEVAQLSNEILFIPACIQRPPREYVAVAPGLAPDAVPREVKPGNLPGPATPEIVQPPISFPDRTGPVAPGTKDGLADPGQNWKLQK